MSGQIVGGARRESTQLSGSNRTQLPLRKGGGLPAAKRRLSASSPTISSRQGEVMQGSRQEYDKAQLEVGGAGK